MSINASKKKIVILIVAFCNSIHTARWAANLDDALFDIHLFPSNLGQASWPDFRNITIHRIDGIKDEGMHPSVAIDHMDRKFHFLFRLLGNKNIKRIQFRIENARKKYYLEKLLLKLKPDILHTMETQHAGYLVTKLFKCKVKFPRWVHSTWGIDLHYYQDDPLHIKHIKNLLRNIDLLIVEGERDLSIARKLGYIKQYVIIPSVGGGLDFTVLDKHINKLEPSKRRLIILKGYNGAERKADIVLNALRSIKDKLHENNVDVVLYSCQKSLLPLVSEIRKKNEFNITVLERMTYDEMLRLTANSFISITNNLSDGVPNTMLEAMALGAFPVQSNTAITEGWIKERFNGMLTNPTDQESISEAILFAFSNKKIVDEAAIFNMGLIRERLNIDNVKVKIEELYKCLVAKDKLSN